MQSVAQLAHALNVTRSTVRNWTRQFAAHLSPDANPPPGQARAYSADDCRVLALVAARRADNASYENIHAVLAAGELGHWPPPMGEGEDRAAPGQLAVQLAVQLATKEGELTAVANERDFLRSQLETERAARIAAEIAAAHAAGELDALRNARRPSFWARLWGLE